MRTWSVPSALGSASMTVRLGIGRGGRRRLCGMAPRRCRRCSCSTASSSMAEGADEPRVFGAELQGVGWRGSPHRVLVEPERGAAVALVGEADVVGDGASRSSRGGVCGGVRGHARSGVVLGGDPPLPAGNRSRRRVLERPAFDLHQSIVGAVYSMPAESPRCGRLAARRPPGTVERRHFSDRAAAPGTRSRPAPFEQGAGGFGGGAATLDRSRWRAWRRRPVVDAEALAQTVTMRPSASCGARVAAGLVGRADPAADGDTAQGGVAARPARRPGVARRAGGAPISSRHTRALRGCRGRRPGSACGLSCGRRRGSSRRSWTARGVGVRDVGGHVGDGVAQLEGTNSGSSGRWRRATAARWCRRDVVGPCRVLLVLIVTGGSGG